MIGRTLALTIILLPGLALAEGTAISVGETCSSTRPGTSEPLLIPSEGGQGLPLAAAGEGNVYLFDFGDKEADIFVTAVQKGTIAWRGTIQIPEVDTQDGWPIETQRFFGAFVRRGGLFLGFVAEGYLKQGVAVFRLDVAKGSLERRDFFTVLNDEQIAQTRHRVTRFDLTGIMGSETEYLLFARHRCNYFHPGVFISGDMPSGTKDVSLTYRDARLDQFVSVEQGRVDVLEVAYAQSANGTVHAVWLQGPPSYLPVFRKYKYEVCHAAKKGHKDWSSPVVLVTEVSDHRESTLSGVSVTCAGSDVLASWDSREGGRVYSVMQGEQWNPGIVARPVIDRIAGTESIRSVSQSSLLLGPEGGLCIGFILDGSLRILKKEVNDWLPMLSVGSVQRPVTIWRAITDHSGSMYVLYREEASEGEERLFLVSYGQEGRSTLTLR